MLTTAALPDEVICLTEQTLVSLEDIAIPENVFFTLLSKTKMCVGTNVSIFRNIRKNVSIFRNIRNDEDFLGVDEATRNKPFRLERDGETATALALENIRSIPPESISCTLFFLSLSKTFLINIFPKLRISEDRGLEKLVLDADKEEQVSAILAQEQPTHIRRVNEMVFKGYAVNALTKIITNEDSEVKTLTLSADKKEQVAAILAQEETFCVGRVKEMIFHYYAVNVLVKIITNEDTDVEHLVLYAVKEEQVTAILAQEKTFCVGGRRVKNMSLGSYAVNVLARIEISEDGEVENLLVRAQEEEHVAAILAQEKTFCVGSGRVKNISLGSYAVNVLTRIEISEDGEVESLTLKAYKKEHVAAILTREQTFCVGSGRVKNISLGSYAVNVLARIEISEDCLLEMFIMHANEEQSFKLLEAEDRSIEVGRIRIRGFKVPEEIKRKLRYTLVDGKGNEVEENQERER
ncbi:MAG: uncharacterized protein A8A55_2991 [Amphiamblys sp. WSBS2006]|nr:MAG: uncharacterized protein A8A55_2991 [Amphiamblys sp. WSBS2006]